MIDGTDTEFSPINNPLKNTNNTKVSLKLKEEKALTSFSPIVADPQSNALKG